MSKCCPLSSFVRTLDNGLSVFIELGQICLSLFARSTFFNYFTGERKMFKFQFSIDMSKKFVLAYPKTPKSLNKNMVIFQSSYSFLIQTV